MSDLAEKIRLARLVKVPVGHITFDCRRPTIAECESMANSRETNVNLAMNFTTGWSGMTEKDLFDGGSKEPIDFDYRLWEAAIGDLPDIYNPIAAALIDAAKKVIKRKEKNQKN